MGDIGNIPFDSALFRSPSGEFRGAPFWAWTGRPEKQIMEEQMSEFREMGFGGFFMHPRVGLDVEYLGEEFMQDIRFCCETAKANGMHAYLYDEDKWPSGFGGGRVTKDISLASKYLLLSPVYYIDRVQRQAKGHTRLTDSGEVTLLKRFSLKLENGRLVSYKELEANEAADNIWYLYGVLSDRLDWFNGERYSNLIASGAAERFLEVTYDKYKDELSDVFGTTVPAIFTDEPSVKRFETIENSLIPAEVGFPYSDDVERLYREEFGERFISRTPELVFNMPGGDVSAVRYRYFDILSRLFSDSYIGKIAAWCRAHNIAFTGHFQDEDNTDLQAKACGDVMRAMAQMDVPGVDILLDRHEYFTLKQAQSVARQYGKRGVSAELYGVTNWDFTPAEHKHQGDWVEALGVTLRVPHLSWMSMKGQMKRDFPASLNHCIPWYKEYKPLEDHFSRLNTVLTRGTPVVNVAVLDPVESAWMLLGPDNETLTARRKLDNDIHSLCEWLLFGNIDFDLLNEALIKDSAVVEGGKLRIGAMSYDVVLLPELITIRGTTLDMLEAFASAGGRVIYVGAPAEYIDGEKTDLLYRFNSFENTPFDKDELLGRLETYRFVRVSGSEDLIYQYRHERDANWLFVAHGRKPAKSFEDIEIAVTGAFIPLLFDTMTGDIQEIVYQIKEGITCIKRRLHSEDSLLLMLSPSKERNKELPECSNRDCAPLTVLPAPECIEFAMEEPNVLLLDMARFRIDGGAWNEREEILRIDDCVRKAFGYKLRTEASLQPWCIMDRSKPHLVELEFAFVSDVDTVGRLGVEVDGDEEISFNGTPLISKGDSWYVDRAIKMSEEVQIRKGENTLHLAVKYGALSGLEAVYLVGRFGVCLDENSKTPAVIALPQKLRFGSVTKQGLVFYGGNLEYSYEIETTKSCISIAVNDYAGAMVEVRLDGVTRKVLVPGREEMFDDVKPGKHRITYRVFGNRYNTFGALHDNSGSRWCYGPFSYKMNGDSWTYQYILRPFGLLYLPDIYECN